MNNKELNANAGIVCGYLAKQVKDIESRLLEYCRQIDEANATNALADLLYASHVMRLAETLSATLPNEPTVPTYMLSSLTIQEACSVLTKTADEDLRFATGLVVAPMAYAITRLLQFELKRKSVVAAEGDQQAVTRLLIGLHNAEHKLFMTWHSHPGVSADSTTPSPIDMDFHRRLEAGNYPVVGAIVNRKGYVRFFSYKRAFNVSVYGAGMEVIDEQSHVYKLDKIGSI